MNWKTTSYNMQTAGDYAVTKHPIDGRASSDPSAVFYIAWHKHSPLGDFDTADQAKARCAKHSTGEG